MLKFSDVLSFGNALDLHAMPPFRRIRFGGLFGTLALRSLSGLVQMLGQHSSKGPTALRLEILALQTLQCLADLGGTGSTLPGVDRAECGCCTILHLVVLRSLDTLAADPEKQAG